MPLLLSLLSAAPSLIKAGGDIVSAVTGEAPPPEALESPEGMVKHIESLPPEQQAEIQRRLFEHIEALDKETTARWQARMDAETAADVEKMRATARPEIARQAMAVIRVFSLVLIWAVAMLTIEWLARLGFAVFGCYESTGPDGAVVEVCRQMPAGLSVTALLAQLEPVTTIIWPPLLASFAACVSVIRAYMGARERDKARADEMAYGRPIDATAATIEAAGGGLASIIKAVRGRK